MDEQDDFDFEVIDLDEEHELNVEIVDLTNEDLTNDSVEQRIFATGLVQPRHRFTLRQRRVQLVITISTSALLLLLLLSSYAPMRNRLLSTLVPPISRTTSKVGSEVELFYFDANPTWGQFFIDGKPVTHLPRIGNANDVPLRLQRGRHVLSWKVVPFAPQQCSVSVPFNVPTDTCHFDLFTEYSKGAWIFRFPMSLAQLPRPAFADLVDVVQTELDMHAPTETVLPGEFYAVNTTGESTRRATQALKATMRYQLDVMNTLDGVCSTLLEASTPCTYDGQECYLFCSIPLLANEIRGQERSWDVFAAVQTSWEYRTQDGKIVAQNQPEILGTTVVYDHLVPLHITWDGAGWHATLRSLQMVLPNTQQMDVACNTALNTVKNVLVPTNSEQAHTAIDWQYISGTNPAEGCLSIATLSYGQDASTHPIAYFLHRFGVLLAVNNVAHEYWPSVPLADAHEQQIATRLSIRQNGS